LFFFSHPDCTVGTGISPVQSFYRFADYHRRSGISPCPEETIKYVETEFLNTVYATNIDVSILKTN
jgi:hypothetical protein